jgi:hypothetical protein
MQVVVNMLMMEYADNKKTDRKKNLLKPEAAHKKLLAADERKNHKDNNKGTILAAFTPQTAKNRPAADMTDMSTQ